MSEQIIDLGDECTISQKKRSGLATASFICSLIFCCPVVTLVGVILGIVAILQIRGSQMTGRGLAWAGIIIGVITTALSTLFLVFAAIGALSVAGVAGPLISGLWQSAASAAHFESISIRALTFDLNSPLRSSRRSVVASFPSFRKRRTFRA